ncbi:MAG TPA: ABC transporter substrate-binding protein, partial [Vicinamibacteria bacterium]|nr:ABC transporter substrate-binding protein [Vicinamibacteria bacterium]
VKALGLALLLAIIPRSATASGDEGSAVPADSSGPGQTEVPRNDKDKPFKKPSAQALDFRGPGREEPEPAVDEVVLGWFGPGDPDHPDFGDLWRGATLALEQENAAGGYRGKPFRLLPAWSESPWKAGIVDLTRLVYDRGAWAVIGGADGTTTHLAVQIALKSHFLLLSPGSTDASADHANVPWLFSLPPSDERIAPVLADAIAQATAGGSFAVVASTDHDSRAALVALRRALGERRLTPATLVELAPLEADLPAFAGRLVRGGPRAVVVLAPSILAGRLTAALRGAGFRGPIVGGAPAGRAAFRRVARAAAEGVIAPLVVEPGPEWEAFAQAYATRWGEPPDEAAAHGYDAVRLVAAAVRQAGLNRALIRDAVRSLAPWPGASGRVTWSALGRNERAVALGSWADGRLRVVRGH